MSQSDSCYVFYGFMIPESWEEKFSEYREGIGNWDLEIFEWLAIRAGFEDYDNLLKLYGLSYNYGGCLDWGENPNYIGVKSTFQCSYGGGFIKLERKMFDNQFTYSELIKEFLDAIGLELEEPPCFLAMSNYG